MHRGGIEIFKEQLASPIQGLLILVRAPKADNFEFCNNVSSRQSESPGPPWCGIHTSCRNHGLRGLHKLDLVWFQSRHGHRLGRPPVHPERRRAIADKVEACEDALGRVECPLQKVDIGVFALYELASISPTNRL